AHLLAGPRALRLGGGQLRGLALPRRAERDPGAELHHLVGGARLPLRPLGAAAGRPEPQRHPPAGVPERAGPRPRPPPARKNPPLGPRIPFLRPIRSPPAREGGGPFFKRNPPDRPPLPLDFPPSRRLTVKDGGKTLPYPLFPGGEPWNERSH